MDAGHILLARSWLYDHDMTYQTRVNTYTFWFKSKEVTLQPLKENISTPSKVAIALAYYRLHNLNKKSLEYDVVYVLACKKVEPEVKEYK